jgi:hypothetical protein
MILSERNSAAASGSLQQFVRPSPGCLSVPDASTALVRSRLVPPIDFSTTTARFVSPKVGLAAALIQVQPRRTPPCRHRIGSPCKNEGNVAICSFPAIFHQAIGPTIAPKKALWKVAVFAAEVGLAVLSAPGRCRIGGGYQQAQLSSRPRSPIDAVHSTTSRLCLFMPIGPKVL